MTHTETFWLQSPHSYPTERNGVDTVPTEKVTSCDPIQCKIRLQRAGGREGAVGAHVELPVCARESFPRALQADGYNHILHQKVETKAQSGEGLA